MRKPGLRDLLELHDTHVSRRALGRVLGDGYFYRRNPVFKGIRDAALRAGFTYSSADTSRCYGWPLMALDEQLRARRIPFVDNVFPVRELERRRPRHFSLEDVRSHGPSFNPLLHESAHGVAFDILVYDLGPEQPNRLKLTKTFLAEAFALAVEKVSGLFVDDSPLDLYLHRLNTHVFHVPRRRDPFRALHARYGLSNVLRATMACYLYASFVYRELGDRELDAILAFSKMSGRASVSHVEAIFASTFDVGASFRHRITSNYLRAHGYSKDLLKLVAFEPLEYVARHPALSASIERLVALVEE